MGKPPSRLVGSGAMIHITAQMRVLVAIEAVDGRNYAPSTVLRSRAAESAKPAILRGFGRRITVLQLVSKHGK